VSARGAESARTALPRRDFIRISAGAAGGLLVTISLPGCGARGDEPHEASSVWHRMNGFLEIDTEGRASVRIPVPEIGQGVRTSLAMLVAEELDVPWEDVEVTQSEAVEEMGPHPFAGGSWTVRAYWLPFRRVGAAARAALVRAAAAEWGVGAAALGTESGEVVHPDGRRLGYGSLAARAATAEATEVDAEEVSLKDPSDFRLIGTEVRHLDTPDITRGTTVFGCDVRLPRMLRAVIARCPVYAGRVVQWDDDACRRIPGFHSTVHVPAFGGEAERPYAVEGVAVVADSTWAALKARDALRVTWDDGPNVGESTSRLMERCRALVQSRLETFREAGDVDSALEAAVTTIQGDYSAPFLTHVPMEPMNCTVSYDGETLEIWAPTQVPQSAVRIGAQVSGLPEDRIRVHVLRSGGGFGRRLGLEFLVEAIPVALALDRPVQLLYTREDEVRYDHFRPLNAHRFEAGIDRSGGVGAWLHRQAGTSRYAFRPDRPVGLSEFRAGTWPAALCGAHRLEYALVESNLPRGPLRAPGMNTFTWAVECFLDEVAEAAGRDPLALRLDLLGNDRELPYDDEDAFSTGRMAAVLRLAADAAGWGRQLGEGRGLGVAAGFTFGTYVAHVAEVTVDRAEGAFRVDRIVSAIDCGRVVNPNGVRHQMEGGALDGLGAALHGELTVEGGAVVQSNFHDFPLLRMSEAPPVEVHWVDSGRDPTGVGEPPYPPLAPAVGNALYAASGVRLRDLPLLSERNRALLRSGRG
jgi:isoquinoline 1-oxidoreductase subunit beta